MTSYDTNPGPFGEPDDDPPARTIPEKVEPGIRFMQTSGGLWDVYDWQPALCESCDGLDMRGRDPCPRCNGTGEAGYLEPARSAEALMESDARLLTFGPALLAACGQILKGWGHQDGVSLAVHMAREALAKVKGEPS